MSSPMIPFISTQGCTSFFPSKPLGCYGDGGAIFTSDDALSQACREIRVHGQSRRYVHTHLGVSGRMDTLQCAIVLAKLDRLDQEITQLQAVGRRYHHLLAEDEDTRAKTPSRQEQNDDQLPLCALASLREPFLPLPWPQNDRTSVFAQYTFWGQDRDELQARLTPPASPPPCTTRCRSTNSRPTPTSAAPTAPQSPNNWPERS